jgi:hypothetical protein
MERIELKASWGAPIGLGLIALMLGLLAAVVPAEGTIIFGLPALFLIFLAVKLGQRRLVIDETGVTAKGAFSTSVMPWNELDHYTFWSMDTQTAYAAGGAQAGLVGVLIIAVGFNGLSIFGAPTWFQPIFKGAILILAVGLSTLARRYAKE